MERPRVFLALFLCFIVTMLYSSVFIPRPPVKKEEAPKSGDSPRKTDRRPAAAPSKTARARTPKTANARKTGKKGPTPPRVAGPPAAPQRKLLYPSIGSSSAETVSLWNRSLGLTWSNRGGVLLRLRLKEYLKLEPDRTLPDWKNHRDNFLTLLGHSGRLAPSFGTEEARWGLKGHLWQFVRKDERTLVMRAAPSDSPFLFERTVTLLEPVEEKKDGGSPAAYSFRLVTRIRNRSKGRQTLRLVMGGPSAIRRESPLPQDVGAVVTFEDEKGRPGQERKDLGDLDKKGKKLEVAVGTFKWMALTSKYFAVCVERVDGPQKLTTRVSRVEATEGTGQKPKENLEVSFSPPEREIEAGGEAVWEFLVHAAPKEIISSRSEFANLESYWFQTISVFLLWLMGIFHGIFGNWGVAIISLTVLVKLLLHPLTVRQQISMHTYQEKMKGIQPRLQGLRERYSEKIEASSGSEKAKLKRQMNEEMLDMFKKNDVQVFPFGGCLPILLQIPIFIGLFRALEKSIHLRQAPFLWIEDLSRPDRVATFDSNIPLLGTPDFNILPLIMIVTWFIQQMLMPKSDDPRVRQQQKIMMVMPIVFGLFFYGFASGLVLYWLMSTFIGIFEQLLIKRRIAAMAAPRKGDREPVLIKGGAGKKKKRRR